MQPFSLRSLLSGDGLGKMTEADEQIGSTTPIIQSILSKLPKTLEESAKTHGVIVRKREIKSAADLLIMFFIYALTGISQRVLAAAACFVVATAVSDQAWQKKCKNLRAG